MAEHLKLISTSAAKPVPGAFIATIAAKDILYTLGRIQSDPDNPMGLICGAPGVGKAQAAWHFKNMNTGVHMMRAVQGEGSVYNVTSEL